MPETLHRKAWKKRWRKKHRAAILKQKRHYAKTHKVQRSDWHYRKKYGITKEEFERRVTQQHGLCPIGPHPFGPRGTAPEAPVMDHNHATGHLRGVLCRKHNSALGYFDDSILALQQMIDYLKQYREEKNNVG